MFDLFIITKMMMLHFSFLLLFSYFNMENKK